VGPFTAAEILSLPLRPTKKPTWTDGSTETLWWVQTSVAVKNTSSLFWNVKKRGA